MCIVLYFEIILFHFIWNLFILKKTFIKSDNKYFPQKYSLHQSKAAPVSLQCHRLSTVIHRQWQESVKCLNSMQKGPSEIAVVQFSRTEYITKCYRNMVDQIPQKCILRPRNQWESHCLHRQPHIWNSRTSGASRHHGAHEGTPAWTKAKPSSSGRSH